MAVTLTGPGGLFTILIDIFDVLEALNTSQGTTVPPLVDAAIDESATTAADDVDLAEDLAESAETYSLNVDLHESLRDYASAIIVDRVVADSSHVRANLSACLDELERQMIAGADTIRENVVSAAVGVSPAGTPPLLMVSTAGVDGIALQQVLPERIVGVFGDETSLNLTSGDTATNPLLWNWPAGSALTATVEVEESGELLNPSFDLDTQRSDTPDNWVIVVGTIGTTVTLTVTEVQTITISGTPTSGHYTIDFTGTDGFVQTTAPIPFDADGDAVQVALAALTGMATVTVETTGTSPDFTHTVRFNAVSPAGDQPLLSTDDTFDVGSILVAESTAGSPDSLNFRALAMLGNGAELTQIRQPLQNLNVTPATVYSVSVMAKRGAGTTGTVSLELVDGTGAVINDDSGTPSAMAIDVSTLSDSAFAPQHTFFRTPSVLPSVFYLQIRASVAISVAGGLFLDDLVLQPATQLYTPRGPYVALRAGTRLLQEGDRYELDVSNDLAGRIQTWFGRLFQRQLPSATSGAETIADT